MHANLKKEIETMGYDIKNIQPDVQAEQDFLIMSRLLKISRTDDFSEDELSYYQWAAKDADRDRYFFGARILTNDFSDEELKEYQWAADHPTGSCRGFCMTDDPTEEEVRDWNESLEYFNKMDFASARLHVKFLDKDETPPYENDERDIEHLFQTPNIVAGCGLGENPYSQDDKDISFPWREISKQLFEAVEKLSSIGQIV